MERLDSSICGLQCWLLCAMCGVSAFLTATVLILIA